MRTNTTFLDSCRAVVRRGAHAIAVFLNRMSGGKLSPNDITLFGLGMHLPIALLIAQGYLVYGGILLIIFGLFDTLDGELARLQNRSSRVGMLLDSSTDRIKEILVYIGIAYYLVSTGNAYWAIWAVVGVGAGLLVSYVNAWGEVVSQGVKRDSHQTNKAFRSGLMSFDVRMAGLVLGLLFNHVGWAIVIVAVLSSLTAIGRLIRVSRYVHAQD